MRVSVQSKIWDKVLEAESNKQASQGFLGKAQKLLGDRKSHHQGHSLVLEFLQLLLGFLPLRGFWALIEYREESTTHLEQQPLREVNLIGVVHKLDVFVPRDQGN